jgi:hypothetical protein
MENVLISIYNGWKASELRRWIRDFNDVPAEQEKLARYASILHEHAQQSVFIGTSIGFFCGFVAGCGVLLVQLVMSNVAAFEQAFRTGMWDETLSPVAEAYTPGAAPVVVGAAFICLGFYLGNRRAYQLRSTAAIALSVSRFESKLDQLIGADPERSDSPTAVRPSHP